MEEKIRCGKRCCLYWQSDESGVAVITWNVNGDDATNVLVNFNIGGFENVHLGGCKCV